MTCRFSTPPAGRRSCRRRRAASGRSRRPQTEFDGRTGRAAAAHRQLRVSRPRRLSAGCAGGRDRAVGPIRRSDGGQPPGAEGHPAAQGPRRSVPRVLGQLPGHLPFRRAPGPSAVQRRRPRRRHPPTGATEAGDPSRSRPQGRLPGPRAGVPARGAVPPISGVAGAPRRPSTAQPEPGLRTVLSSTRDPGALPRRRPGVAGAPARDRHVLLVDERLGFGLLLVPYLYPGPNGPEACREQGPIPAMAAFHSAVLDGAPPAAPATRCRS